MSSKTLSPVPVFSDAGAQDNVVVVREAQEWIQVCIIFIAIIHGRRLVVPYNLNHKAQLFYKICLYVGGYWKNIWRFFQRGTERWCYIVRVSLV